MLPRQLLNKKSLIFSIYSLNLVMLYVDLGELDEYIYCYGGFVIVEFSSGSVFISKLYSTCLH